MAMPQSSSSEMTPADLAVQPTTLVEVLQWRARSQADVRAFTFLDNGEEEKDHLTYGELDQRARIIAAFLLSLAKTPERAVLLYPPGLEFIAAFFGCLYAGWVAVPAYPPHLVRWPQALPRLRAIRQDAQPLVALTESRFLARASQMLEQAPDLRTLTWRGTDVLEKESANQWRDPGVTGDSVAFLQYTSGSTGSPKGVMVSHANLLHNNRMIKQAFQPTEQSTVVGWLPFYHDMGLIGNVLQPVYLGTPCVLMSPAAFLQRPIRWLQAISRYRAHASGGPNFAYDLCVRKISPEQRSTLDLTSWKVAFNGAEPVRHDTLERFASAFAGCGFRRESFYPCYGLAEATLFVTGGLHTQPPRLYSAKASALDQNRLVGAGRGKDVRMLVSCGRPWRDGKVAIVDPESLTRTRPNQIGEVWVGGPHVAQGYWKRAEETEKTFRAYMADTKEGPFLRTGDLGVMKDGELYVTGRLKDLIIIDGRNHYPQDIEQTVEKSHPALRAGCCAAFAVDLEGEERLVIMAELDPRHGADRTPDEPARAGKMTQAPEQQDRSVALVIRRAVAESHDLHVYKVVLLAMGSIPKTSSGKIQRHLCKAKFLSGQFQEHRLKAGILKGASLQLRVALTKALASVPKWPQRIV